MREPVRLLNTKGDYAVLSATARRRYQTHGMGADVIRFTHTSAGTPMPFDRRLPVNGRIEQVIIPNGVTVHFYSDVRGMDRIETFENGTFRIRRPESVLCIEVIPVTTTIPPAIIPRRTAPAPRAAPAQPTYSQTTSQTQMTWVQIIIGIMVIVVVLLVCVAFYWHFSHTPVQRAASLSAMSRPSPHGVQSFVNIAPPGALPPPSVHTGAMSPIVLPPQSTTKLPIGFMSEF